MEEGFRVAVPFPGQPLSELTLCARDSLGDEEVVNIPYPIVHPDLDIPLQLRDRGLNRLETSVERTAVKVVD